MKKILISMMMLASVSVMAQNGVGIGTDSPRPNTALDVRGNILLDGYVILTQTGIASTSNQRLLVRSTDSNPVGEVKLLNVNTRNVGPVNKYTARINNVSDASVLNLKTNLSANKYYLGLAEATFSGARVRNNGSSAGTMPIHGTYYTSVGIDTATNTYTISLNFNNASTENGTNGNWDVSFIVFERTLVKDWGVVNGSVSASATPNYSGVSNATPAGLQ